MHFGQFYKKITTRAMFFSFWISFFDSSLFRRELIPSDASLFRQIRAYSARYELIRPAEYALFVGAAEYALSGQIR